MRRWIVAISMLALMACGDDSPSKPDNGVNNANNSTNNANNANNANNTNNANNANNVPINNANNLADCREGTTRVRANGMDVCAESCPDGFCSKGFECNQGFCTPPNNETPCDTRAQCRNAAECVDGQCVDHQSCLSGSSSGGFTTCGATWENCDDGKVYEISCENFETCSCVVNDVETHTFEVSRVCEGDNDVIHRIANENCGWLVPAFR